MMIVVSEHSGAEDRQALVKEVAGSLGIATPGLRVLLAHVDSVECPNPKYRVMAFHMNVRDGGIEAVSPEYVLSVMTDPNCTHLIWVSKRVVDAPEPRFLWILAHELGHHLQDVRGDTTGPINGFIRAAAPRVLCASNQLVVPNELDAEMRAMASLQSLRGTSSLAAYREAEIAREGESARVYFDELDHRAAKWPGSIRAQVRAVLARNPEGFRRELRRLQAGGTFGDISIDPWLSN